MNTQIIESPQQTGVGRNLTLDAASMSSMVALAEIMATGKATIPKEYQGSKGDCLAVVMQAVQWGMNPFAVAQKTHFISGKIGYEAQLVNSVITALAPTKDRLHFEWFGDWTKVIGKFEVKKNQEGKEYRQPGWKLADEEGLGVRCWATMKGEDEPRMLELLLAQARTRNSTLWADDPRQQLAYLAVKRWSRLYCPDVIMGVYTPDELDESKPERDITPTPQGSGLDRLMAQKKQQPAEQVIDPPKELPAEQKAKLEETLELMSLCQSHAELKSVSEKVAEIGALPDADAHRAKVIYQQNSNRIKESLAAEANNIPV